MHQRLRISHRFFTSTDLLADTGRKVADNGLCPRRGVVADFMAQSLVNQPPTQDRTVQRIEPCRLDQRAMALARCLAITRDRGLVRSLPFFAPRVRVMDWTHAAIPVRRHCDAVVPADAPK